MCVVFCHMTYQLVNLSCKAHNMSIEFIASVL